MGELFVVGYEVGNVDVAIELLDERIFSYLVTGWILEGELLELT